MREYRKVEIQGKHGMINLMIPEREPTQEEIDQFYKVMAEAIIESEQYEKKKPAK